MPTSERVHVDAVLSNLAIQYRQDQNMFIGDMVSPPVPVKKESDKYIIYTKKDRLTLPNTKRGDGDRAKQVSWDKDSEGTYVCEEYALEDKVTDRAVKNADKPIDVKKDTQDFLVDLIMLDREKRVADATFNATTFSSYTSILDATNQWDQYEAADSNPLVDIQTGKDSVLENSFKQANTVIMGQEVYSKLINHPVILDRITGGSTRNNPGVINDKYLAEIFDVERVLIGRSLYNSNNIGQTASYSYVWGKYVMVAYINPSPMQIKNVTMSLSPQVSDFQTETWYEQALNSTWVRPKMNIDEIVPCAGCGYLFQSVVS